MRVFQVLAILLGIGSTGIGIGIYFWQKTENNNFVQSSQVSNSNNMSNSPIQNTTYNIHNHYYATSHKSD